MDYAYYYSSNPNKEISLLKKTIDTIQIMKKRINGNYTLSIFSTILEKNLTFLIDGIFQIITHTHQPMKANLEIITLKDLIMF